MAKLPNILNKRPIIYTDSVSEDKVRSTGELFLENGFFNDAIDCFSKIKDIESLKNIKKDVVEMGDFFLAQKIKSQLEKKDWENLAKNAENNSKFFFASQAYEVLENEDKQKEMLKKITAE